MRSATLARTAELVASGQSLDKALAAADAYLVRTWSMSESDMFDLLRAMDPCASIATVGIL